MSDPDQTADAPANSRSMASPFVASTSERSYWLWRFFQKAAPVPKYRPRRTAVSAVIDRSRPKDCRDPVGGHPDGERELIRAHVAGVEFRSEELSGVCLDACHWKSPVFNLLLQ